jgi:capsular polysaccharide biosynthesis protein
MEENEVELMDYLQVIWKRKWIIIIPTLICMIAAGVVSFILPRVWEIDALIRPGKFFIQTEDGLLEEVVVGDRTQITDRINQGYYNSLIATELNLDIREIPKIKAEDLKNTDLIRISLRREDIEKAKIILHSLFKYIKRELDAELNIVIKEINSQIETNEITRLDSEAEIAALKKKLNIVKQRRFDIGQEMNRIRKRIELLERERSSMLKKLSKNESESLAMLLNQSEIQQSLRYYNLLNEHLINKKIEEEDIHVETEKKERRVKQIESEIDYLKKRKDEIDYTQLIKEPTASLHPVAPRKKLNVLIAAILGLMIFTSLAFFLEYVEK